MYSNYYRCSIAFLKRAQDNSRVKKNGKSKFTAKEIRKAAVVLGTSSWQTRTERFTPEQLSMQLSAAGKLGGRPRKLIGASR